MGDRTEDIQRVARVFSSFEEAEASDREFYRSLTPQQRIEIQLELIRRYRQAHGISERLERVAGVIRRPAR